MAEAPPIFETDLVIRNETNRLTANSFATYDEIVNIVKFRPDVDLWNDTEVEPRVRFIVAAYHDLNRLTWQNQYARSQSRDYEFQLRFTPNEPPLNDPEFMVRVKQAQVAQLMFLLAGSQVRDMARDGVLMTRALTGSELEITGYRGAVCAEAKEYLGPYIELYPRMRRLG